MVIIMKLKHCPFCGGKAGILDFSSFMEQYTIGCTHCGVHFVTLTKDKAIEVWNRRVRKE